MKQEYLRHELALENHCIMEYNAKNIGNTLEGVTASGCSDEGGCATATKT